MRESEREVRESKKEVGVKGGGAEAGAEGRRRQRGTR